MLSIGVLTANAQEGEPVVVDQVIAQVDSDVIMLSALKREMKEAVESLSKQQGMPVDKAQAEVNSRQAEIIATLINEQLLLAKGKELDLSNEIEAEVNRRMLEVAQGQNIKTMDELYAAMRASGLDPDAIRQTLRVEIMKNAVFQREVDSKLYYGFSNEELQAYFKAHPEKFKKPESVTLSEIFLSLAGKNPATVEAQAKQIIEQARGGASFAALAKANSERMDNGERIAEKTNGAVGTFEVPNLREDIAAAIKNLKTGGTSDILKSEEGYQIIHVDQRTAGSDATVFNEQRVREALTNEKMVPAREKYLQNLRDDAYIKVSDDYSAAVLPLLKLKSQTTASTESPATKAGNDKKKKKN